MVTFGDNSKGKIIGIGSIVKDSSTIIENIFLVKGLKHNLLSINQLSDKGFKVIFESSKCYVVNTLDGNTALTGMRQGNIYVFNLNDLSASTLKCLSIVNKSDAWLWHRRLGHTSMSTIFEAAKHDMVVGLPKIKF